MIQQILHLKEMRTRCWRNICNLTFSQPFRSWYEPNRKRTARRLLNRQVRCSRAEWAHSGDLFPLPHPQMGSSSALLDDWERRARKGVFLFKTHPTWLAVQDFCGLWMLTTQPWAQTRARAALLPSPRGSALVITHLRLLLREFHVVKNPEHDSEQVLPPVLFKGVAIALHDLEHHCEPSGGNKAGHRGGGGWEKRAGAGGGGDWDPGGEVGKGPPGGEPERSYLVRTSSLHLLMMQESSKSMGNQPRTQTLSPGATFMSSLVYSCSTYNETIPQRQTQQVKGRSQTRTTRRWKPLISPSKNLSLARVCWGILQR